MSQASRKFDSQGTIRQANGVSSEPSDEYDEDFEDQPDDGHAPGEDELPDTTMLDSVVLPAIASVRSHDIPETPVADDRVP